jgi:hypothetical protein
MITILLVKRNGEVEEKNVKQVNEDALYRACNFKSSSNFSKVAVFEWHGMYFSVFGKMEGKANHENKYEFPSPIDTTLFFGTMCIVKHQELNDEKVYVSTSLSEWETVYEGLFGGFDDIENSDEEERSMDSEVYDDEEYTSEGYLKDDFVVEDDELEEEEYLSYESE